MFFIFLLSQRHLHPVDVENRPNGLTINIFIGRQVGTGVHKSDQLLCLWGSVFNVFFQN